MVYLEEEIEIITLLFYVTRLMLNSNRFNSLILEVADPRAEDCAQFIHRWIMANGETFRCCRGEYCYVRDISTSKPIIIEPGVIFQTNNNELYQFGLCVEVDVCAHIIYYKPFIDYQSILLSENNPMIQVITDDNLLHELLDDLSFGCKQKMMFLLNKTNQMKYNTHKFQLSLNVNITEFDWNGRVNEQISSNKYVFLHEILEPNIETNEEYQLDEMNDLSQIIANAKYNPDLHSFPSTFISDTHILLIVEIWTDDFAPWDNPTQPNISFVLYT